MFSKQILPMSLAALLGAGQVFSARVHGAVEDYNGGKIRWHQIARGMYSGVPDHEWDDEIHKPSDHELPLPPIYANGTQQHRRDLADLQSRNLQGFCQATKDCVTGDELVQLVGCIGAFVEAADTAKTVGTSLWDFLNQPFVATVTGATIAGVASNQINNALQPPVTNECSTAGTDKDALLSAVSQVLSASPDSSSAAVDITGPTTSYTVTVTAVPEDETPPTPVSGQCFTARSLARKALGWTS